MVAMSGAYLRKSPTVSPLSGLLTANGLPMCTTRLQLTLNIATKDGNGVEVLTVVDDLLYVNLAWSPDGTEIAFDNIGPIT